MVLPYINYNIDEVGAKNIPELEDVNLTNLANGQALIYDSTLSLFTNQDVLTPSSLSNANTDEVLKKNSSGNIEGADILSTASTLGTLTKQKTIFVDSQPPFSIPLSSIESKNDNGVYSMILNPNEGNIEQKGMTLLANNNNTRVGINVANPTEDLEIDGNIQLDSNNQSRIIFYDTQNDHEHAEIDATGSGTNGGDILFKTKNDGGIVSEKMRITNDGNVGINKTNPLEKLDVNGTIRASNLKTTGYLDLNPDGGLPFNAQLRHDNFGYPKTEQVKMFLRSHTYWSLQDGTNGGDGNRLMVIDVPLEVNGTIRSSSAMGTTNFEFDARNVGQRVTLASQYEHIQLYSLSYKNIYHWAPFQQVSDDRLKWEETPLTDGLDVIMTLKPVSYWRGQTIDVEPTEEERRWEIGLIAQEVEKIPQLKHCVTYNESTPDHLERASYTLNYSDIHNYHLSATQELYKKLQELTDRINVLESRI